MQSTNCLYEGGGVVEPHDVTGRPGREEVGLAAAVVTHDRQAERHRFQEYEAEAFVLARRHERVRDGQCCKLFLVRDLPQQIYAVAYAELGHALRDGAGVRAVADH
jgi:hypothetical protein